MSEEFKSWRKEKGITHLTGAPYHPATTGAAEGLVQTFMKALKTSSLPPKKALPEFVMQFRRTPNFSGYSLRELLNSRERRRKIDALLPSPAHVAQEKQAYMATKSKKTETIAKIARQFNVGDTIYVLYSGTSRDREPRWVLAIVTKRKVTRAFNVHPCPRGPT